MKGDLTAPRGHAGASGQVRECSSAATFSAPRASSPIRQPDFQLKPVTVAGSMMKVKDEIKLTFDVVAHK